MQELVKPKSGYKIVYDFFKRALEIPENWEYPKFSNIVEVNPRTKIHSKKVLYIPMEAVNVEKGSVDYFEERNAGENASLPKFQENDVLFARITPCTENGKVCLIENFSGQGIASSELTVLRATDKVIPHYLFYYVQMHRIKQFAISQMTGTTGRQRVPDFVFKKDLNFELPPLEEQQKIASIFSKVDELVEEESHRKQILSMLKKGLMQKLLTGKIRVKV